MRKISVVVPTFVVLTRSFFSPPEFNACLSISSFSLSLLLCKWITRVSARTGVQWSARLMSCSLCFCSVERNSYWYWLVMRKKRRKRKVDIDLRDFPTRNLSFSGREDKSNVDIRDINSRTSGLFSDLNKRGIRICACVSQRNQILHGMFSLDASIVLLIIKQLYFFVFTSLWWRG